MQQLLCKMFFIGATVFVTSLFNAITATADSNFRARPVAFTDQEGVNWGLGPNLLSGEVFDAIVRDPIINNSGEVAFRAFLNSDGGSDESVWSTAGGMLTLALREGLGTGNPGLGGDIRFRPQLTGFSIADTGEILFNGGIQGPGIGPSGIGGAWIVRDGVVHPIAVTDSTEYGPELGGAITFSGPSVAESGGKFYVGSSLQGGGVTSENNRGIWSYENESLVNIFRKGELLASYGFPGGGVLQGLIPQYDDIGRLHASVTYGSFGNQATQGTRFYSQNSNGFELVVGTGNVGREPLPGVTFSSIGALQVSRDGEDWAFTGSLAGPSVEAGTDRSVWYASEDDLQLIARSLDVQFGPQLGDGRVFESVAGLDIINNGTVLFRGTVIDPSEPNFAENGFWVSQEGVVRPVAVERSDVFGPGFGPGVEFFSIETPAIDETGAVVFKGRVVGPGYNSGNNIGVWRWKNGSITNILQKRQLFDVDPDPSIEDLRKIEDVGFSNRSLSKPVDENNNSTFVVRLDFGFGGQSSGIFLITAIPEPTSVVLLILGVTTWISTTASSRVHFL